MTPFRWTDRDGRSIEIESCARIEAEYREVAAQILALKPSLESADDTVERAAPKGSGRPSAR